MAENEGFCYMILKKVMNLRKIACHASISYSLLLSHRSKIMFNMLLSIQVINLTKLTKI